MAPPTELAKGEVLTFTNRGDESSMLLWRGRLDTLGILKVFDGLFDGP